MIMKKIMLLGLVIFSLTNLFAQSDKKAFDSDKNIPNFSGKWELINADGVKVANIPSSRFKNVILDISFNNSELVIVRSKLSLPDTERFIYYSDNRGESNPTPTLAFLNSSKTPFIYTSSPVNDYKSKTTLKDGKLITAYDTTSNLIGTKTVFLTGTDKWQLSSDGTKLILTSTRLYQNSDVPKAAFDSNEQNLDRQVLKYTFKRI